MPITPDQYERLAEELLSAYEDAELHMLRTISRRLAKGVTEAGWAEEKYAEVKAVRKELQRSLKALKEQRETLLDGVMNDAYAAGAGEFFTEAERFTNLLGIRAISPNSQKVARILADLNGSLEAGDRMILRQADDAYADIVGRVAADMATGTLSTREAVSKAVDEFAERGITSFIDKAGRCWEMGSYAEMALLTAIEKATVAGYVDTMQSYGFDLAVISSHVGACPLCAAWQGVIISVSGRDRKYQSLDDAQASGVFHPRCRHHLSTYYEGITKNTRSKPAPVKAPESAYTDRSKQRHCERMIRKWKRRMVAATEPQNERLAFAHVRKWRNTLADLIDSSDNFLYRHYDREGGRVKLSKAARRLKPIVLARGKKSS